MSRKLYEKIESLLPTSKINVDASGSLIMSSLPYYLLSLILISAYFFLETHPFYFLAVIYPLFTLFDEYLSLDWRNATKIQRQILQQNNVYFKIALYFNAVVNWILFFKMMNLFATFEITPWNFFHLVGIVFMYSNFQSGQFLVAHEIFHKQTFFDRFFGTFHMSKLLYMHFTYEHIWGHHKRVATPEDPASAEKGINFYKFFVRTLTGSYKSVYNMELQAKKPIYMNCAVLSAVSAVTFAGLVWRVYGTQAFIIYMISAFGAILYLQATNYIEHYGLRREKKENGEYEKVTIKHSWNASHRFSNYLLFKLQRHSDHHENCLKPYQTLDSLEDSPQLSHGYSFTILMALRPDVWFSVMDPLVDEYNKVKTGSINSEVRAKANKLIRIFIVEMTITNGVLCIVNEIILGMGRYFESNQFNSLRKNVNDNGFCLCFRQQVQK